MSRALLDASVPLAILQNEKGADAAAESAFGAFMSIVNMAELIGLSQRRSLGVDIPAWLEDGRIELLMPTVHVSDIAGRFYGDYSGRLSLGDCFCLAQAEADGLSVLTADRVWAQLDLPLDIQLIR